MRTESELLALEAHLAKRSWSSLWPRTTDTRAVRAKKRTQAMELLELKLVELDSFGSEAAPEVHESAEGGDIAEIAEIAEVAEVAEVAETPVAAALGRRLPRGSTGGTGGTGTGGQAPPGSAGASGDPSHHRVRGIRPRDLRRVVGNLPSAPGSIYSARTNPGGSLYTPITRHGRERQEKKRDSLSRSVLLRRGMGGTTPGDRLGDRLNDRLNDRNDGVFTPTGTQAYTSGTPGVYIPEVRQRYIDVTGTELAMGMARDFVAGIFEASEPCSLADSGGGKDKENEEERETENDNDNDNDNEEPIENQTDDPIDDDSIDGDDSRSAAQVYRIPYAGSPCRSRSSARCLPPSFLMRFPEHCLCGRVSRSGRHVAILLGSLIDKEPKEIVVMSLGEEIAVSQVVGVQKSARYFPRSIPFNVNFFDLTETTKGDPVLLVSCAFELTDDEGGTMATGTMGTMGMTDTKLYVLVRGKEAVVVESEEPIIFVEAFGDGNEVLVTGAYADDGARVMKFDPLWQSFAWKKEYDGIAADGDGEGQCADPSLVTHISKLLVVEDEDDGGAEMVNGINNDNGNNKRKSSWTSTASIKAVLATADNTSVDVVYTFGGDARKSIERIENAEVFMGGDSWRWFLVHQKRVAELGFAGGRKDAVDSSDPTDPTDLTDSTDSTDRTITAIFASAAYVAVGDVHGMVTVWDMRDGARLACKKFSIAVFEPTKVTSIVQIRAGANQDQDAMVVTGWSGVCLIICLPSLFSSDSSPRLAR